MRLFNENFLAVAVIWQEARNQPREGKIAVGEVIRRRAKLKYNSNGTITDTIFRPYQFSGMNTADKNRTAAFNLDDDDPLVIDCAQAWAESQWSDYTNGAVLYLALDSLKYLPPWVRQCRVVAKIGAHTFYVEVNE
jgi:spore germination cell wall hydrolase CwlJ-like protein